MQDSANHPLDDVKADKEERKYKTLIQDRIDKRLVFESGSEPQILTGKQYLCQHEGVKDRKTVSLIIWFPPSENDALINDQQDE